MSRRTERAAQDAARAASEAAKVMQQRSQEVRQEREVEPDAKLEMSADPVTFEKALSNRPSSQAMDEILAKREAKEPAEETPPEVPVEAAPAAPEAPKAEEAPPVVADAPVAPEAPKTVRVKVDGEEYDAPAEEVDAAGGIHAYQRDKASENRLKKASETAAETKRMMAQVAEMLQAQAKAATPPPPTDNEFIASKLDEIRFGTPEQASAALQAVLQRSIPRVDPGNIAMQATANMRYEMADQAFKAEFQDIAGNPLLMRLAKSLEQEAIAPMMVNGQPDWQKLSGLDWSLVKRTIGNQVRSAVGRQSQPAPQADKTQSTPSSLSEKEARKASITVIPTAAARAEKPAEPKELSPEEERKAWIAEQKKSRGQG